MKTLVIVVLLLSAVGYGTYWWYSTCGGFNSCNNPVCEHDCYENGKRTK